MTPKDRVEDELEDDLESGIEDVSGFIAERPLAAVAIAAAVGFVLARILF